MKINNELLFAQRLSLLIDSGISLEESLRILEESEYKIHARTPYRLVREDILSGISLSKSFEKRRIVLDATLYTLIQTGETSGSLGNCLRQAFLHLEKKGELQKKVVGSLVYPMFIVCATIGMTLFLILFIFPKIIPLLSSLNISLPLITRVVLAVYHFAVAYGAASLAVCAVCVVTAVVLVRRYERARYMFQRVCSACPILGGLMTRYILASLVSTLHILLSSGTSLYDGLNFVARASKNMPYRYALTRSAEQCAQGISLAQSLQATPKLFPPLLVHMILIGEKTGNLSLMCMHVGKIYADEVESSLKKFSSLIEPLLMILMGLVVGSIALSIILPVYEITNHLNS